jgi:hypothetical protein
MELDLSMCYYIPVSKTLPGALMMMTTSRRFSRHVVEPFMQPLSTAVTDLVLCVCWGEGVLKEE